MDLSRRMSGPAMKRLAWMMSTSFLAVGAVAIAYSWSAAVPPASAAVADRPPVALSALVPQQVAPSADYFLKLEGVDGESTDDRHKGELEILSWSFGATQTSSHGAGGGGGAGKVSMQDFHFTAHVSKASPRLYRSCATGEHIKQATLTVRKAGGGQQEYLVIKLSDVQITSYQLGASEGDIVPTDQVSFNFTKIEFEYRPRTDAGTTASPVRTQYDVSTGRDG